MSETNAGVPRDAVTVLLVRHDPLAVLMVERGAVGAFPGALVFPGGVVDAEDADAEWLEHVDVPAGIDVAERARRVAAARELWEETRVLLGHGAGAVSRREAAGVGAGEGLLAVLRATGLRVDLGLLHPLSRWLTPEQVPKRFDTRFYAAEAAGAADAGRADAGRAHAAGGALADAAHADGADSDVVTVDGVEIVGAHWLEPRAVLAEHDETGRHVMLPTRAHLARLEAVGGDWAAWSAAFRADPRTITPTLHGDGASARPRIDPAEGYPSLD